MVLNKITYNESKPAPNQVSVTVFFAAVNSALGHEKSISRGKADAEQFFREGELYINIPDLLQPLIRQCASGKGLYMAPWGESYGYWK